jgi:hypothetical protein
MSHSQSFGYSDEHRPWLVAALLFALALAALGCATGTVQTTYGPRPAAEVQAQDLAADIIASLEDGYRAAVVAHDQRVMTEDPLKHAANRALLIKEHDALVAAAQVLIQWKMTSGSGYSPAAVMQPLLDSLPAYLALAVDLGAMKQADADKVLAYAKTLFPTFGGLQ